MAAIVDPEHTLRLDQLADGVRRSLPAYARPLFIRILDKAPLTGKSITVDFYSTRAVFF